MKTRTVFLAALLVFLFTQASSCGTPDNPSDPFGYYPTLTPAPPTATAEPTPVPWDPQGGVASQCEYRSLGNWRWSSGQYISETTLYGDGMQIHSNERYDPSSSLFTPPPQLEATCEEGWGRYAAWDWPTFHLEAGNYTLSWSASCMDTQSGKTQTQEITISPMGWEVLSTPLGDLSTLHLLVNSTGLRTNGYGELVSFQDRYDEWFACGLGRVRMDWNGEMIYQLLSYTPGIDEAIVRNILADIAFGSEDFYRTEITSPENVFIMEWDEALRRWDAGITVTNLDQFERRLVNGYWIITYAGTDNPINGLDVILSSDPQP